MTRSAKALVGTCVLTLVMGGGAAPLDHAEELGAPRENVARQRADLK